MRLLEMSSTRRLMLWFFDDPSGDPYVSVNFDVDITPLRNFLDAFEREHAERITIQHVVTKAVAKCLAEVPALNVKIMGRRLHALDRVDIAMPVHLDTSGSRDETGMVIVRSVDRLSLLEVANATRRTTREERGGTASMSGSAFARKAMRALPNALLHPTLGALSWLMSHASVYQLLEDHIGISSAVTNVGSVVALPKGARFHGASATIPCKFGHLASVFAVAPTQVAAVVEDGSVSTRTVLPLVMIVDHRAIDGVLMGVAVTRVVEALLNPATLV